MSQMCLTQFRMNRVSDPNPDLMKHVHIFSIYEIKRTKKYVAIFYMVGTEALPDPNADPVFLRGSFPETVNIILGPKLCL